MLFRVVFPCHADWRLVFSSARIVLPPVSGAMRHVPAKDVKSMVSRIRVWTACARPEKWASNAVLTNVKARFRLLLRQLHTQVSSPARGLYTISHIVLGFPPNGEGPWVPPSDQGDSALPGGAPAIAAQYMPPEGYWPYPYYPPPPGYVPPPPDGHTNGDGAPHGQPPHHPAYYPIHPGYPPVPMYPPPPGAYGPMPTMPGQAQTAEQAASNQAATSDDERAVVERPKKKKRAGGEDGVSKSSKKSKQRGTNPTSEAPAAVVVTAPAPASDDSPDDHGSPVAHNGSGNVGGEPLPPVIAAA